ncbi:hypothetical protein [Clostridium paraputrificum]|uniref:hypothetical protein n=1 Tax=Clostridium paraputrificum TaxID=29363 RepID=UPI0018A00171|nr:hypothetical protein [Clostridium paraputrificum]
MITLVGREHCMNCTETKNILSQNNIDFEYKILESLNQSELDNYLGLAQKYNTNELPLIIEDNKIITLEEVLNVK